MIDTLKQNMLQLKPVNLFDYKHEIEHFQLLESTIQDKNWHAEGNVLIHTNMVVEKAYELCQKIEDKETALNIYFGSLLHDFGKPFTTFTKPNGKVVAYGHEETGVPYAREFLRKYFPNFGFARREHILSLVEYHKFPKMLVKDNCDVLKFKKLSLETDTNELYFVEVADFTGRTGEDNAVSLQYLNSFRDICAVHNILGKYYTIPDCTEFSQHLYNLIRWNILFHGMDEKDTKKIQHLKTLSEQTPCALMLTVGAPGSGKSTLINREYPHARIINMDDIRKQVTGNTSDQSRNEEVFKIAFAELDNALKQRLNVVWDATSVTRKLRKVLIDKARQHGAYVGITYFDLPLEEVLKRNRERERNVPEDVIKKKFYSLQMPRSYEYDKLLVVNETMKI